MSDSPETPAEQNAAAPETPAAATPEPASTPIEAAGSAAEAAAVQVLDSGPTETPVAVGIPMPTIASKTYIWGTGRRKSSVARVRIRMGKGTFEVNGKPVDKYFCLAKDQARVREPLGAVEADKKLDIFVNAKGGGITGQTDAIVLGLARALYKHDDACGPALKERNLLSRDPRKVERKKYGQRGARRRFQFSKR